MYYNGGHSLLLFGYNNNISKLFQIVEVLTAPQKVSSVILSFTCCYRVYSSLDQCNQIKSF
jgi:hypothetical protein